MRSLVCVALLGLAACVNPSGAQTDDPSISPNLAAPISQDAPFDAKDWVLSQVNGKPAPFAATIRFEGQQSGSIKLGGQAPCNRYFAPVQYTSTEFRIGPVGATRMACAELAQETAFFALLGGVNDIERRTDAIYLLKDGAVVLTFVKAE